MTIKTVLDYVQTTLSDIDSDEVDSIDDTEEARQVATTLRECYDELIQRQEWSFLQRPITLTSLSDVTKPTSFTIPPYVRYIEKIWYNVSEDVGGFDRRELIYLTPEEFLLRVPRKQTNDLVVSDGTTVQFIVNTIRWPQYWTAFDDNIVHLDSYPSALTTTLTTGRISALGVVNTEIELDDEHVPDLPEHMVPLLQNSLTASASQNVKQQANAPAERKAVRQLARLRRNESRTTRDGYYRNQYGRR